MSYHIVIIGSGASGLMAACCLAEKKSIRKGVHTTDVGAFATMPDFF